MKPSVMPEQDAGFAFPSTAPLVRITAGFGSAGQKTWNLRRPVTLVGSQRPAHIVLHGQGIEVAHCVIVHTGRDVLLMDLHTKSGTLCNQQPVETALLKDGDIVMVGSSSLQVAIQVPGGAPGDSGCGMEYVDPLRFAGSVSLELIHTERRWSFTEAAAMIGRGTGARIHLDHEGVSTRHALIFKFLDRAAVYDLGSRTGIAVNGESCAMQFLSEGDRLTVGPFGLTVHVPSVAVSLFEPPCPPPREKPVPKPKAATTAAANPESPRMVPTVPRAQATPASGLSAVEPPSDALGGEIKDAWERINVWRKSLEEDASVLEARKSGLTAREAELDARDAALRGQLHDVTRFHEQLSARERDLQAKLSQYQAEADALTEARKAQREFDLELQKRDEEISRRENVVSQRWSRLQATKCPNCGKPLNTTSM